MVNTVAGGRGGPAAVPCAATTLDAVITTATRAVDRACFMIAPPWTVSKCRSSPFVQPIGGIPYREVVGVGDVVRHIEPVQAQHVALLVLILLFSLRGN